MSETPPTRTRLLRWLALLLLGGSVGWYLWSLFDAPPPTWLLRYGLPTASRTTGRTHTNSLGMELVEIAPGFFRMGSHDSCGPGDLPGRLSAPLGLSLGRPAVHRGAECPVRWVRLPRPFWIGRTEVSNAQFERFRARERPLHAFGDDDPAVQVSWDEAAEFCAWLGKLEAGTYRLPTEAEWEYCCRAGSFARWSVGDLPRDLRGTAWFGENSANAAHPVGSRKPNAWGIQDMHGNVAEWCSDWFAPYPEGSALAPAGPGSGLVHAVRGGDWADPPELLRSAYRAPGPAAGDVTIGFRVVRVE